MTDATTKRVQAGIQALTAPRARGPRADTVVLLNRTSFDFVVGSFIQARRAPPPPAPPPLSHAVATRADCPARA